jgi:radical SAM superfamily enzyme YgiQ (UPF0313 family)
MKNKVLLIRPSNVYNYNNYPPLNLILLASALETKGFSIEIINSAFETDIGAVLKNKLPDALFVAITLLTPEVPDAIRIMQCIRDLSDVPIIAGGWHCTLFPEQMAESRLVDFVITGEGEDHIVSLASDLQSGKRPEKKIYEKKVLDINALPEPDYSLEPSIERFISCYLTDTLSRYVRQPIRWLPYESSRGCPSECTFCINVVTGNRQYRKKDAAKVISDIENIVTRFRLTHIKFIDDNFFVDIRRVRDICRGIIDRGLSITWDAECRCDYFNDRLLNDETLSLAKKAGLVQLTLGIESGSPRTLDLMKKHITPEQAEHAVRKCNEHGIIARSSFMLEVPGERMEDIMATIRFVNRMRQYPFFSAGVGTFRPYPKCELTLGLINNGYLKEPQRLDEWISEDIINMYTAAEYIRPWQVNGPYSVAAAYYLNMESSTRLGSHQLSRLSDRVKNSLFITLAAIRNRLMFYRFPVDMELYKRFLADFYRDKGSSDRQGCYPLSKPEGGHDT